MTNTEQNHYESKIASAPLSGSNIWTQHKNTLYEQLSVSVYSIPSLQSKGHFLISTLQQE